MRKPRGNAYYKERLKNDHPTIAAEVAAGRLSLSDALKKAGLKKPRTRLQEMMNAWGKATKAEKEEFLKHIGVTSAPIAAAGNIPAATPSVAGTSPAAITSTITTRPTSTNSILQSQTIARVQDIMVKRKLKAGDVAEALGFNRRDMSLQTAMLRGTKIDPRMMAALEKWLTANSHV